MLDGALKEADHHLDQLIWVVQKHIVACIAQFEDLGLARLEVAIVLHDFVRAALGAKKVSRAIHTCDWEIKVLQSPILGEKVPLKVSKVLQLLCKSYILLAYTVDT